MTDINIDVKTGRLVKDLESKEIGKAVLISGTIAVNRSYKKDEQWVEEASFFNFKQWLKSPKQAEYYANNLKKGTQVTVSGEFIQEKWEKDGKQQSAYVLMANNIIPSFGNSGKKSDSSSGNGNTDGFPEDGFPSDVPF